MSLELPDEIHAEVTRLSEVGNALSDAGNHIAAVHQFEEALALLPTPIENWSAALWLFVAIGDSHYLAGDFEQARIALNRAQLLDASLDNPFIWLRRGQVYYELNNTALAGDCLASAYILGGPEIFNNEDPKYSAYILPKLKLTTDD